MRKPKKIIIFDFDETLVNTVNEDRGRALWLEKTGEEYPHIGWWAKHDSLSLDVFEHPLNEPVYNEYNKWMHHRDAQIHLVTGRITKVQDAVEKIIHSHSLSFDGFYCNGTGKDTFSYKTELFQKMIEDNPQLNEFVIYDDRDEHIFRFKTWMEKFDVNITLHDVVTNTVHTNF